MFSAERGLTRAVAKGARKPGTKMAGKSEALCANRLLLAKGKSFDIITQAESINTFSKLRGDLVRLTYGLYYAELTQALGEGLEEDSNLYYLMLYTALEAQELQQADARLLCLEFEMCLLRMLGMSPELKVCVKCRRALTESNVANFFSELGGIGCNQCSSGSNARSRMQVAEGSKPYAGDMSNRYADDIYDPEDRGTFVTPLVWKIMVTVDLSIEELVSSAFEATSLKRREYNEAQLRALDAGRRLMQRYLEERAGKRMKTLDLLKQIV